MPRDAPRDGDPEIHAELLRRCRRDKTFAGTYDGKTLDVCTGTTFPWSDGCQWRSAQHFRGDPKSGFLTFTYSEMPYQGMGCQPPCQAFAQVKIGP